MKVSETIEQYLKSEGYNFDHNRQENGLHSFRLGFRCTNGGYTVKVFYSEKREYINIVIPEIAYVERSHRNAAYVYSLLMDINYNIVYGKFSCDESDGEIRFELTLPAIDYPLEILDLCFCGAISTVDRVFPFIMQAIYGDDPEKALAKAREERTFIRLMGDIHLDSGNQQEPEVGSDSG